MQAVLVVDNQMPLCFRSSRSDGSVETLHYIPGTSLLGGLAAAYIRMKQGVNGFEDAFARFFTSRKILFGNLYPANFKSDKSDKSDKSNVFLTGHELPVRPIPATAHSCKRFSGFRFQNKEDEEKHGVCDDLIRWTLFALHKEDAIEIFNESGNCHVCGKQTTPFSGFYRQNSEQNAIGASKIHRRVITRAGISRGRGAVMEGILYNREILSENQQFWGILDCHDDLWDDFEEFLNDAFGAEAIYLGNNKTRGLGKIENVEPFQITNPADTPDSLKKRIDDFSDKLKEKASANNLTLPHAIYIPMTLQSDLILRDELMRYRSVIEPDYLENRWNLKHMEPIYHNVSIRRVMGWNSLSGLPKADSMAINMGSVFLFGVNGNTDDAFWQNLSDIQTKGIGEHCQEGFGKIMIAEPFHMEVDPL